MTEEEDPMWELSEELRDIVDDPDDVGTARIGGDHAYVVPAGSESEAKELAETDVDAADEVEMVQTRAVDAEYGVAFKIEK